LLNGQIKFYKVVLKQLFAIDENVKPLSSQKTFPLHICIFVA